MFNKLLDFIFPPKCGFCKRINRDYLCKKCELKINYLKKDRIIKVKNEDFDYQLYGYLYKDEIRRKILDFKFNDKPELADTFVKLLLNNKKICRFLESYDIIIPVPMYKKKQIIRGYNQTELIARKLARYLCLEHKKVLVKIRDNKMQSSLDAEDRKNNVKDVYECTQLPKIYGKTVVLFDDIYTTGSTVRECAKKLKEAGSTKIAVLTIAKD